MRTTVILILLLATQSLSFGAALYPSWDRDRVCNPLYFTEQLLTAPDEFRFVKQGFELFENALKQASELSQMRALGQSDFPDQGVLDYTFDRFRLPKPLSEDFFIDHDIPKTMQPFYDLWSGAFFYKRDFPLVLSSENGREKLKVVRIAIGEEWRLKILEDYLQVLEHDPKLELWVSSHQQLRQKVEALLNAHPFTRDSKSVKDRIKVEELSVLDNGLVWTQDSSKPLVDQNPQTVVPYEPVRPTYLLPLKQFEKTGKLQLVKSPFHFEGGNVIVGDRHLFMGTNDFLKNMKRFKLSRKELGQALEAEFGRPVFEVGVINHLPGFNMPKTPIQPDFHIDLTFSVVVNRNTQKEVVLLDSGLLLLEKLKALVHSDQWNKQEYRYLKYFLDEEIKPGDFLKRERQLNQIALDLQAKGYEVMRIPGYSQDGRTMVNYTNSIYSGDYAIVPKNGLRQLDQDFKAQVQALGYTPIAMPVVQDSQNLQGGIRCLSETFRENFVDLTRPQCLHLK